MSVNQIATGSDVRGNQWEEDCQRYWGRVLAGERAHWCPDWDFLPIDETTETEIECCTCDVNRAQGSR